MSNKKIEQLLITLGETTLAIYKIKKSKEDLNSDYEEAMKDIMLPIPFDDIISQLENRKEFIIGEILKERGLNE